MMTILPQHTNMMDGIFREAEEEDSLEILDDGDANMNDGGNDDDDDDDDNLDHCSASDESCDHFVGVILRGLANKEPLFWEKNLFDAAINNNKKTLRRFHGIQYPNATQRLNRYARHVHNSGLYEETLSSG